MQLIDGAAARLLMQAIDVLGDDRLQLSRLLQSGQRDVRRIRRRIRIKHFIAVEAVEFLRILQEKRMTDDGFRRNLVFLMLEAVRTPEIRNAAFGGYSGSPEKYNTAARVDPRVQQSDLIFQIQNLIPFRFKT